MYPPPPGSKYRENTELCVTWSLGSVSHPCRTVHSSRGADRTPNALGRCHLTQGHTRASRNPWENDDDTVVVTVNVLYSLQNFIASVAFTIRVVQDFCRQNQCSTIL